jgi:hypothetical protein
MNAYLQDALVRVGLSIVLAMLNPLPALRSSLF